MRILSAVEVVYLHQAVINATGGTLGIRDADALEGALLQPFLTYEDRDLYPSLVDKAASLCFSLITWHPFMDGNKRVGHAAMAVFLQLNGQRLNADVDEQEQVILTSGLREDGPSRVYCVVSAACYGCGLTAEEGGHRVSPPPGPSSRHIFHGSFGSLTASASAGATVL